jgi:hypothetical protein
LAAEMAASQLKWYEATPWAEVILGVRAIVPFVIFLMLVLFVVLAEKVKNAFITYYGIIMAVVGMCTFNTAVVAGYSRYKTTIGFFSVRIPTTHNKKYRRSRSTIVLC